MLVGFGGIIEKIIVAQVRTVPVIRRVRDGPIKFRFSWMKIYDEKRKMYGRPLTLLADKKLRKSVELGGFYVHRYKQLEMDGLS